MKVVQALSLWLVLFLSVLTTVAFAVCDQTSASQADNDLWQTHGCWREYYLWQYREYDVHSPHWDDRGFFDACNPNLEYPKHWNATYLINYGLADNILQSWHGATDYQRLANASHNEFKYELYHTAGDRRDKYGMWTHHPGSPNEITTYCLLYDSGSDNGSPASRAGDFVHEGWHGWYQEYGYNYDPGHFTNPEGGRCTATGANCDYFYFHGIGAYAFGAMYQNDGTANQFHSPNQAQVEFLCDVADQSKDWVPASVRIAARSDADARASERFINGPGYKCGTPRPW
jgi:hypothetical protein